MHSASRSPAGSPDSAPAISDVRGGELLFRADCLSPSFKGASGCTHHTILGAHITQYWVTDPTPYERERERERERVRESERE
jgi:hypothetical protein